jgi:hypothetical protein
MSLFQPGYLPAQALAGNVFIGSSLAAGVAIPAYNATAQVFGVWNPAGSGKNLILLKFMAGVATAGTPAVAALGLSYLPNAGGSIATGAPISAFTDSTPVNGLLTKGNASAARFTLAATITAPTFFYDLGVSQESATPGTGLFWVEHDFDGAVIIPPGVYVGVGGSAAPGQTIQSTLVWMELAI